MSLIPPAAEAYHYPLLIKQLLTGSNGAAAKQEIISNTGDTNLRLSYADFRQRIAQLANALRSVIFSRQLSHST